MPEPSVALEDDIDVLIVDDSAEDIALIRRLLSNDPGVRYRTRESRDGGEALEACRALAPDCLLLDYQLPDLSGLEVLDELDHDTVSIPIVMLTGAGDRELGLAAMRRGAQDYLDKSALDSGVLNRSIRYAIERTRVLRERQRRLELRERELRSLDRLSGQNGATVSAAVYGAEPIRSSASEDFATLVERYGRFLEFAVQRRITDTEDDTSRHLRKMSEEMGLLRAGPQDVVDIYVTALRKKSRVTPEKADIYADEGRLLALELMGHLVSYYRTRDIGHTTESSTSRGAPVDAKK